MTDLTDRQVEILRAVRAHVADTGDYPTVAELAARTGLARSTAHHHLRRLEVLRVIAPRERRRHRAAIVEL